MNHSSAQWSATRLALAALLGITLIRVVYLAFASPNLSFDEAQYWAWSQHFQLGYFSKPPMVAWVIALTTFLFGDSAGMIKLGSALAQGGAAWGVFATARALYGDRVAIWAGLGWISLPAVFLSSLMISTDPFLLLFWSLGLWCLVRACQTGPGIHRWWLGLGLCLGLGLLSKYAMAFFVLCLVLWIMVEPTARRWLKAPGLWLALGLGGLIYAPNAVWNARNGFVSYAHTKSNANLGGDLFHADKMGEFLLSQMGVFGPVLLAGLVIVLLRAVRPGPADGARRFLLCFSLPVLLLMVGQSFLSRANANWSAPAFVAAVILVSALWAERGQKWLRLSLVLHLLVGGLLLAWEPLRPHLPPVWAAKLDVSKRIRGWDVVGDRVSWLLAQAPGHRILSDERKLLANLTYYVRPHPFDAVKWNPDGLIHDYFDQTTRLEAGQQPYLYVTERPPEAAQAILRHFQQVEMVEIMRQTLNIHSQRTVTIWRVQGFQGYGP